HGRDVRDADLGPARPAPLSLRLPRCARLLPRPAHADGAHGRRVFREGGAARQHLVRRRHRRPVRLDAGLRRQLHAQVDLLTQRRRLNPQEIEMPRFRAFRIHHDDAGHHAGIESMDSDALSPGEVLVKVAYSSVNYKDALAGTGKGRILRQYPLNGGIDAAGHVVASTDPAYWEGDAVLFTGSGPSETRDGGYGEYARLDARWTIPLPASLSLRESMIIGTAGF